MIRNGLRWPVTFPRGKVTIPKLTKKYPLQMITPHAKYSYHTQHDNKNLWLDDIPQHRIKKNGYAYWPIRLHP